MPPSQRSMAENWQPRSIGNGMRGILLLAALGMVGVLGTAFALNPYQEDGQPRKLGTHQQLGLPGCTYLLRTGQPCPSCGLTTSFSLMMHGDVRASLRTNWVGTMMVLTIVLLIPWLLVVIVRGRAVLVQSLELAALGLMGVFALLLIMRWVIVLWMARTG